MKREIKLPRHDKASNKLIGDLIFKARQFKMWSKIMVQRGDNGGAKAHLRKSKAAEKSLRTLGFTGEIFD